MIECIVRVFTYSIVFVFCFFDCLMHLRFIHSFIYFTISRLSLSSLNHISHALSHITFSVYFTFNREGKLIVIVADNERLGTEVAKFLVDRGQKNM